MERLAHGLDGYALGQAGVILTDWLLDLDTVTQLHSIRGIPTVIIIVFGQG